MDSEYTGVDYFRRVWVNSLVNTPPGGDIPFSTQEDIREEEVQSDSKETRGVLAYDTLLSDCCKSRVDFIRDVEYGKFYYLCKKCIKPCEAYEEPDSAGSGT